MEFKFDNGQVLKDRVSGFQGVVIARTEYATGCRHYGMCSQELHDGKPVDWEWFDESRLFLVIGEESVLEKPQVPTSGPFPNAPQS